MEVLALIRFPRTATLSPIPHTGSHQELRAHSNGGRQSLLEAKLESRCAALDAALEAAHADIED